MGLPCSVSGEGRTGRSPRQLCNRHTGTPAEVEYEERVAGEEVGDNDSCAGTERRPGGWGDGSHQHWPEGHACCQQETGGNLINYGRYSRLQMNLELVSI